VPYVPTSPLPPATPPHVETLIRDNVRLVHAAAARHTRRGVRPDSLEDVRADALVGLWRAARKFDPASGRRFSTYAHPIIEYAIIDGLRKRTGRVSGAKARPAAWFRANRPVSLECSMKGTWRVEKSREDGTLHDVIADPHVEPDLDACEYLLRGVPARERRVLMATVVEGLSGEEVAAELGCAESNVSLIYAKAIRTARELRGATGAAPVRTIRRSAPDSRRKAA
jgi:RNA polymerase sigma factor (sigma-70 family)